jgi:hypothetical protein
MLSRKLFLTLFLGLLTFCRSLLAQTTVDVPLELASDNLTFWVHVNGVDQQVPVTGTNFTGSSMALDLQIPAESESLWIQNDTPDGMIVWFSDPWSISWLPHWELTRSASLQTYHIRFVIPESRYGHSFVMESDGVYVPLSTFEPLGYWYYDQYSVQRYATYGFFIGSVLSPNPPSSPSPNWRLIDVTTHEAAPTGVTNVMNIEWQPGVFPLIGVTVFVPDSASWYTFVTSSGSTQSLWPTWDGTRYVIQAQAAAQDTVQITRQIDGAVSPEFSLEQWGASIDLAPYMAPYVGRNLQSIPIYVGETAQGRNLVVVHADGYRAPLIFDAINFNSSSYVSYYDDDGNGHSYWIYPYIAEVDYNQPWWYIEDENTGESFGQTQSIEANPIFPHMSSPTTITLQMRRSRSTHALRIVQTNGEEWNVRLDGQSGSHWTFLESSTQLERYYEVSWEWMSAPASGEIALVRDLTTGEEVPFNGGYLAEWYLPKTTLSFQIHESRYHNTLLIIQPNTAPVELAKQPIVGTWTQGLSGLRFQSAGYFNANVFAHPDAPFWIWDSERGEYLSQDASVADLRAAASNIDSDEDGFADWLERRLGTDPFSASSNPNQDRDGDGVLDRDEYVAGTDPGWRDNPSVALVVSMYVYP